MSHCHVIVHDANHHTISLLIIGGTQIVLNGKMKKNTSNMMKFKSKRSDFCLSFVKRTQHCQHVFHKQTKSLFYIPNSHIALLHRLPHNNRQCQPVLRHHQRRLPQLQLLQLSHRCSVKWPPQLEVILKTITITNNLHDSDRNYIFVMQVLPLVQLLDIQWDMR